MGPVRISASVRAWLESTVTEPPSKAVLLDELVVSRLSSNVKKQAGNVGTLGVGGVGAGVCATTAATKRAKENILDLDSLVGSQIAKMTKKSNEDK